MKKIQKPDDPINFSMKLIKNSDEVKNWTDMQHQPVVKFVNLDRTGQEFDMVETLFMKTCSEFAINSIRRIQNPHLMAAYLLKKLALINEHGAKNVKTKLLFHGTSNSNADSIARNNFDWRFCGESRGHKFGQGVSFSPDASYSTHYTDQHSMQMLLAKVLIVKSTIGDRAMKIPPKDYDTSTNEKRQVFVKYDDNCFYPAYKINFTKRKEEHYNNNYVDLNNNVDFNNYNTDHYSYTNNLNRYDFNYRHNHFDERFHREYSFSDRVYDDYYMGAEEYRRKYFCDSRRRLEPYDNYFCIDRF